jgi:mRNA-degrading endonuclease toxin of MazEF toxin-antitoxin module
VSGAPRRGEVWEYKPVVARTDQRDLRLIVSTDAVNDTGMATVLAVRIEPEDPGGVLAVRVGEYGWATAVSVAPTMRSRLVDQVGTADVETMEHVGAALRAVLDL